MNRTRYCLVVSSLFVFSFSSVARAQERREMIVPAGTLLHCTLDEPDFSSKTAEVGDPVICHLTGLLAFNRTVFPRGAYLAGHLVADKEPGHFVGKGYLKIEFERIGLPDEERPLPAKVIAARGYKVNRKGEIVGHGHAVRDAAEWMFPPLWPEKIVTLPARGPRPTLKGEEPLTLRLMDDVAVPDETASANWHPFGRAPSQNRPNSNGVRPDRYVPEHRPAPSTQPAPPQPPLPAAVDASADAPGPPSEKSGPYVLVLRDGTMYAATNLRVDEHRLTYVLTNGAAGAAELNQIDWNKTFQNNAESGVTLKLQGAAAH